MSVTAVSVSSLYLAVLAGSVCVVAVRISGHLSSGLERVLVAGVVGASQATGVPLLLAMAGQLARWPALAAHITVVVVVELVLRLRSTPGTPGEEGASTDRVASLGGRMPPLPPLTRMAVSAAAGALAFLAALPTLAGRLPGGTDTRNYHIANLTAWLQEHSLWVVPFQNPGFFTATHPGNAEMFGATLVMATGQDHLLYLVNIAFGALGVVAAASIATSLGGRAESGALAALGVLAVPIVFSTHANSLLTDLPAAAGLLAGLALLLRALDGPRPSMLLLAGMALGLGAGAKYTVVALTAVLVIWAVLRFHQRVLWLAPGLLGLAAPWLVRNIAVTGNPIFPQGLSVGGVAVLPAGASPLMVLETSVIDHAMAGRWEVLERWVRLGAEFYGPIALVAAAGGVAALVRARGADQGVRRLGVAAVAVLAAVVYLNTPFTGGGPEGLHFLMGSNLRYLLPAMLVAAALAAVALPRSMLAAGLLVSLAYAGWRISRGAGFRADLDFTGRHYVVMVVAALLAVAAVWWWPHLPSLRSYLPVAGAAGLVGVAGLGAMVAWVDARREPIPLEAAIDALDPSEVLVLGSDDLRSLLGPGLDRRLRTFSGESAVEGGGGSGSLVGQPVTDPDALSRAVSDAPGDVVVVHDASVAVPPGWVPPPEEWEQVGTFGPDDLYVRNADPGP